MMIPHLSCALLLSLSNNTYVHDVCQPAISRLIQLPGSGSWCNVIRRKLLVLPLLVMDNSNFSPSRLTFPLEAPYSPYSEGNGPSSSFQVKRMLHEHPDVSACGLAHLRVFRCCVLIAGPNQVLSGPEQQPRCAQRSHDCGIAAHPRRLPRLSSRLERGECRVSTSTCTTLE